MQLTLEYTHSFRFREDNQSSIIK